jgi:D-alanyl-D-alanine dipeptidase
MAYPVRDVVRPAVLAGYANGRLPDSILVSVAGQAGGPTVRLVAPAAAAWQTLCAAAKAAGHILKASGVADSYRPYSVQVSTFQARYTTTKIAGRPTRSWQGKTWWQRPGTAVAAVPGTSNHGWGLAVDVGVELDADPAAEPLPAATLNWLLAHALSYGFSWETQSEPWHIRFFAGDHPPTVPQGGNMPDVNLAWGETLSAYLHRIEALWVPAVNAAAQQTALLTAIAKAQGVAQQDLDDIQARTGGITLTDVQVELFAAQVGLTPEAITAAARKAIDGRLDDDATT